MSDIQHKDIKEGGIHTLANWKFSTASERNSAAVLEEDIGKIAHQTNNNTLWWLVSSNPTWKKVLVEGDSAIPIGLAGGSLQGSYPSPLVKPDSHSHTPGVSIPAYPSALPPIGNAGGDLTGNYPNPSLKSIGNIQGVYQRATLTVNNKGLITNIIERPPEEVNTIVDTPDYSDDSDNIATTKYTTQGAIYSNTLAAGETLKINQGYSKEVRGVYSIKGTVVLSGKLHITDTNQESLELNYAVQDLAVPEDYFKLVVSGYSLKNDTKLILKGILKII